MSNTLESGKATENPTVYGAIGIAIFLICFGFSYLIPNIFPEGALFILAGFLILLVNIVKWLKNIGYSGLQLLFGIAFLVTGLNKVLNFEISFIPLAIVVLAIFYLLRSINKLRNGQIFD